MHNFFSNASSIDIIIMILLTIQLLRKWSLNIQDKNRQHFQVGSHLNRKDFEF